MLVQFVYLLVLTQVMEMKKEGRWPHKKVCFSWWFEIYGGRPLTLIMIRDVFLYPNCCANVFLLISMLAYASVPRTLWHVCAGYQNLRTASTVLVNPEGVSA